MPEIAEAFSQHYEGENVRTLGRVVGLDQVLLNPDTAGDMFVSVFTTGGRLVYTRTVAVGDPAHGVLTAPEHPDEWDLDGDINFDYTLDADLLASASPPFAFKGGKTYKIKYVFDTDLYGSVIGIHTAQILAVPG